MPYARRSDLTLYFEQEGEGDPSLLFVHGWCCDHSFFEPQFEHFKSTCTVTTLDLRGCGSSSRPEGGYDIPGLADDVKWLCGELGVVHPVVIGHGLGGMIGIESAARHPTLPRAIVGVDPGPINPTPESQQTFEGFVAEMEGPSGEDVRRAWVEATAGPTVSDDLRRRVVDTMCSVPLSVAIAVIRGVVEWNGVAALGMCDVPVAVLQSATGGDNDPSRLVPLKADLYFGLTVGAGHFHQLEVPDQVTAMIDRFLQLVVPHSSASSVDAGHRST